MTRRLSLLECLPLIGIGCVRQGKLFKIVFKKCLSAALFPTINDDFSHHPSTKKNDPSFVRLAIEYSRSSFPPTTLPTPHHVRPPHGHCRLALRSCSWPGSWWCHGPMGRCEQHVPLRLRPPRTACDNLGERSAHAAVEYACTICNLLPSVCYQPTPPQRCLALSQALRKASRSCLACSYLAVSFNDPPSLESRRSIMDIMINLSRPRRANAWLRSSELAGLGRAHSSLPIKYLSMTTLSPCSAPFACAWSALCGRSHR